MKEIIYTVRVDVNDTNYGVLKSCATNPGMFYDVSDAADFRVGAGDEVLDARRRALDVAHHARRDRKSVV